MIPRPAVRRTVARLTKLAATLVVLQFAATCATQNPARPAALAAPAPSSTSPFDAAIQDEWEGVQLEVSGATPGPGGGTTMFFHHGTWAAEVYWRSPDDWCLARVYDWSVASATGTTSFNIEYSVAQEYVDCVPHWGEQLVLAVSGARVSDGRTVYDASYTVGFQRPTLRVKCAHEWNADAPCGFSMAAAVLPTVPGA
jgi:hypothetical protein